jgi:hypothetical protein
MTSARYCIHLSRLFTSTVSWSMPCLVRLANQVEHLKSSDMGFIGSRLGDQRRIRSQISLICAAADSRSRRSPSEQNN